MDRQPKLRPGGEFDLIAKLRRRLEPPFSSGAAESHVGIGDDAAVTTPRGATVTSVDTVVEGVHFRLATASPRSVGWKALAVSLSDLAAMGAMAGCGLPPSLEKRPTTAGKRWKLGRAIGYGMYV